MTVTETQLRPMVQDIVNAYPNFAAWYAGLSPGQQEGTRKSWARQVATLEPSDVRNAVDAILDGQVPMPKNYEFDRLGFELKSWGNVAAARRIESERTETLREQARPTADPSIRGVSARFGKAIKCAAAWGTALRGGLVSEQANEQAMATIHRFHRQGDTSLPWPDVPAEKLKDCVSFWKD